MISLTKLLITLVLFNSITARCRRIAVRREIRDLSDHERYRYINAVRKLHLSRRDIFSNFTKIHVGYNHYAHGVPGFFPWHRQFIYLYEKRLREIDPGVVLPFWDITRDAHNPAESIIFSDDFFGGNGRRGDHCVVSGPFANWRVKIPYNHCLRRQFDRGDKISPFYPPEAIEALIRFSDNYDEFRVSIEGGPHGVVHLGIGGSAIGDMFYKYSPNDPIFYLLHGFVDMLWAEWQARKPSLAYTYNGKTAKPTDDMPPFNVPVNSVFRTTSLCYTYPRFKVNLPKAHKPHRYESDDGEEEEWNDDEEQGEEEVESPNGLPGQSLFKKLEAFINILSIIPIPEFDDAKGVVARHRILPPRILPEEYIVANNLGLIAIRVQENLVLNLIHIINKIKAFRDRHNSNTQGILKITGTSSKNNNNNNTTTTAIIKSDKKDQALKN